MIFAGESELEVNKKYGDWIVVSYEGKDKRSRKLYKSRCKCGFEKTCNLFSLKKSKFCKSCSISDRYKFDELIGKSIGNCFVVSRLDTARGEESRFLIRCNCGKEKSILGWRLKQGKSTSCPKCRIKTHGMTYTSTFSTWRAMLNRCLNKSNTAFKYYGARGIKVCERWLKFENFFEDMGLKPLKLTLDRIDNDGNYEPGNCRWATISQQNSNKRKSII